LNGTILPPQNSQEIALTIGENSIQLMVIAQDTSTQTYTLNISRGAVLAIETSSLPCGLLGNSYLAKLTAKGGKPPYTWSSTDLPAGLSLEPTTGEISGIPESEGTYDIQITVTDAQENRVIQDLSLQLNLGYGNGGYLLTPVDNSAYTVGHAVNGFPIMTVNQDISDLLHFPVKITPINGHTGEETVVFVHLREEMQIGINTAKTDFDLIPFAQTTFEVQAEDLIKVYMVDDLQSDPLLNPNIL
ncbi:MAG: putative Ig domain-containing protein, partial [Clostridia bacterium]|nr:putative Ig domain-containing protein [Clostridia bacterium]